MYKPAQLFEGWNGYETSLMHAVTPLTPELAWRPTPERRSIGELIRHISLGRIDEQQATKLRSFDMWSAPRK